MFSNQYQSGHFLQVWDSRVNVQKNATYKQLFKKMPNNLKNFYDKQVKSYIYELQGGSKIMLPNDDRQELGLHQKYLVLQLFIPLGVSWSFEFGFTDISNTKKRINITTSQGKQQLKYFSFRYPLEPNAIEKGIWTFLAIDLYSFCNAFKNTIFRSLDHIVLQGCCKIRRIFTMKQWIELEIPKNFWLGLNVTQTLQLIQFKQVKEQSINLMGCLGNSSVNHLKMLQSKHDHQSSIIRMSQKASINQKQVKLFKLPQVNIKKKQSPHLKSSKISQKKQQLAKKPIFNNQKDFSLIQLYKSNRSLSKAHSIIEKSKFKLTMLKSKQNEILNKLKFIDDSPGGVIKSQKLTKKNTKAKINSLRGENIFKSDLFKSEFNESYGEQRIKGVINPKILKVRKKFEEDNVFRDESYSSSFSRVSQQHVNERIAYATREQISIHESASRISQKPHSQSISNKFSKQKQSKLTREKGQILKTREQIIEQDVWTQQEQHRRLKSPVQQILISQQQIPEQISSKLLTKKKLPIQQTIITRQDNKQQILKNDKFEQQNKQLQLIYDQMVGCYYHPESNTYYEIKG